MPFTIRVATDDDFEQIHSLNTQFSHFIKTPEKFKITIQNMMAEKEFFEIYVAEDQGRRIVGFATTFIAWYSWIGKSMYLDDLFVVEQFRGMGIGTKLIDQVIEQAKSKG